jgi:NADH:ubiquinone oxidoreductase subunit
VLKTIFTWWNGGSFGALFHIRRLGVKVGSDNYGNTYYEARDDSHSYDKGRKRRWVIYSGYADASKVPAEWHGWLHYTFDDLPTEKTLPSQVWETDYTPNLTGTVNAWRPKGSIARSGERPHATGDYQAWKPD